MTHNMNKMASKSKERFDAAINVIHSLPKDGPFQPSNEMMLTFYGYYKQATEGPCTMGKPNFWEVVKKAKWDAWQKLGNMDRHVAMDLYVEELKKTLRLSAEKWNEMEKNNDPRIVEAMPQTGVVTSFMQTLGQFYELVDEEPPMPGVTRPGKSGPNNNTEAGAGIMDMSELTESALKTYSHVDEDQETAPSHTQAQETPLTNGPFNGPVNGLDQDNTEEELVNGVEDISDVSDALGSRSMSMSESEDEFCDTSDNPMETQEVVVRPKIMPQMDVQMSTPMKNSPGSQRVHFADQPSQVMPNGKISPIPQTGDDSERVYMPPGFPYISKKVDSEISDSMMASAGDMSVNTLSVSQVLPGDDDTGFQNFSSNNSSYIELPKGMRRAEGGEEPEENRQPSRQGQRQGEGSSSSRTGSGRGNFSGSGTGRRALLSGGGGAAGGGGEDNPPHGQFGPPGPVDDQLSLILARLQQDMTSILDRLNTLETQMHRSQREERSILDRYLTWWPFSNRTARTAFFILVWPVIVHLLLSYLFRRRRRNR